MGFGNATGPAGGFANCAVIWEFIYKAGFPAKGEVNRRGWIPAFAGMTVWRGWNDGMEGLE